MKLLINPRYLNSPEAIGCMLVFETAKKELGLENERTVVLLDFKPQRAMPHSGEFGPQMDVGGVTQDVSKDWDGKAIAVMLALGPCELVADAFAHEMVHVKQAVKRELYHDGETVYFKGEAYPGGFGPVASFRDEVSKPWEAEAYRLGPTIAHKTMRDGIADKHAAAEAIKADIVAGNMFPVGPSTYEASPYGRRQRLKDKLIAGAILFGFGAVGSVLGALAALLYRISSGAM